MNKENEKKQRPYLGWKPHWMMQRDGQDGWRTKKAQVNFVHMDNNGEGITLTIYKRDFKNFCPFGVAQMDNGEIIMVGITDMSTELEKPIVTFSKDGGDTWTQPERVGADIYNRPMYLAYLGKGNLTFITQYGTNNENPEIVRVFSSDYGRTWGEHVPHRIGLVGCLYTEGNPYIEKDSDGNFVRMGFIGYNPASIFDPVTGVIQENTSEGHFCWSYDGGRTYEYDIVPEEWYWYDTYEGKEYKRGCSEGSLVRAANGWLVAGLRPDMEAKWFAGEYKGDDNMEGLGVSISKDDGKTWSPIKTIFSGGKMHPHLLKMPDDTLVMTYIVRQDISEGNITSYTRGCGALISRDNGITWDTGHEYLLDSFQFADGTLTTLACGHVYSTLLDDGSILTCYGHYASRGGCLIKWKP